jgi:hypothetical protein
MPGRKGDETPLDYALFPVLLLRKFRCITRGRARRLGCSILTWALLDSDLGTFGKLQ